MREWCDKFKLGKSAFVKRDLRPLPLTEAEFDADFFFDRESSSKDQERWIGIVVEREFGALLAMEDVELPPPTVNDLANLLAHAMSRPPFVVAITGMYAMNEDTIPRDLFATPSI